MRGWPVAAVLALAIASLGLMGLHAAAQEPSPIPNWTTGAPGTSSGQYAQNPYQQQPQYSQQPQYEQPPAYQQPPAYGQPYGQPQYQQQPPYGQDYGQQAYGAPDQGYAAPYQPSRALSPDQLEQLVAPIALYPDNLLSMVLAASTYPAEVSAADQWLRMQGGAPPAQIAAAANEQGSWDPSIKALTAFPQVLDGLAQNLQWTTDLGNAYYNQPQDVMQTVQVMRSRAQQAGNLQTTPQEVVTEDQGNIEIAPPTPDVVYVPAYNPWAVYGQPVNPYPDFNLIGAIGSFIGNALVNWGPGIAMQAFSFTPFGWLGWGLDWLGHAIFFNHDVWSTNGREVHDWGFAHGGARYWGSHGEMAAYREHGAWGGRGGEQHTFRSGLDRGGWGNGVRGRPQPVPGGNQAFGNRGGQNYGHGFQGSGNTWGQGNGQNGRGPGFGYGSQSGGYRQPAYNHMPEVNGHPQQFAGARPFDGRSQGYGSPTYGGNRGVPSYGNGYGRQSFGSSGIYNRPSPTFGAQGGYGGYGQSNRLPGSGAGNRAYSYGGNNGSNNYARSSPGNGFFGGGHSNAYSYGGGNYKAPKSPSFGGGHSWGGGGFGGGYKAPKAPHFSSGGGGHFGGGSHFGGGHSGGGGGGHHSGGGGHNSKHH